MSLKKIAISTSVLAAAAFGTSAFAQDSGYYVQGNVGANFVVQDDAKVTVDEIGSVEGSYDTDTGYALSGALGKYFANGLRGEVEVAYRSNDFSEIEADGESLETDGDISSVAFMLNGYYDFTTNTAWTPYVGGGIGYASVDVEDESEGAFAWQLKGGVSRAVGTNGAIGAELTYFATPELDFNLEDTDLDIDGNAEVDYGNTTVGVFYRHAL